ncbi:aspartate/glutamate racemase family protein [Streptomyces sp. NPDC005805]|uniref:aspartate/glutamate racemase family protein n=1 Tax=Streptomyces sp. NPDC005805 TaxID=3157068 RepID=UPI0033C59280
MLALLHTSPVHVPVFDALRDRDHPGLELRHLVRPELLERARREGTDAVAAEVAGAVGEAAAGARAVLCTCSTIGGVAEAAGAQAGVPVLRVDRPMAAAAARYGRVVVVAAVESTLAPTVDLIRDEARAAGAGTPRIRTALVEDAWERFEAGDRDGYLDAVARAVTGLDEADADAVVLAQASMADAAARATTPLPVLASPALGLRAAAETVARA